jgi:hypothetical protein
MSAAPSALGQATRACGRGLNFLFRASFALLLVAAVAAFALAARLSQGPLVLPFAAAWMERQANAQGQPGRLSVGQVALAWEEAALDRPIDLRVADIRLADDDGRIVAALPEASVSISLSALLLGRVAPRAIDLRGLDLRLSRGADGSVALDGDSAPAGDGPGGGALVQRLLAELTGPDDGLFGQHQLRRVRLTDARATVADAQLGATWRIPDLDITLRRAGAGIAADGGASLAVGAEALRLGVAATWRPGEPAQLVARIARMQPARLAAAMPALAPLAIADADLALDLRLVLDAALRPVEATLAIEAGPGRLVPPGAPAGIPIVGARAQVTATPAQVLARGVQVTLDAGAAPAVLLAEADLALGAAPRLAVRGSLARFDLAQLGRVWPEGLGGAERAWLVPNVTAGIVSDVAIALAADLPPALDDLVPTTLAITGRVEQGTVHWLRPMPPAEAARGTVRVDLDTVAIAVEGGRVGRGATARGTVRLTDLATRPQHADIALDIAAPVAEVLTLLQHPRLKLFDARPLPASVREATGAASAKLTVRFPLWDDLPVDQVRITAEGTIAEAKIPRLLAGQDVTEGRLALTVSNDGMRLAGPVRFAGVPASVTYEQDFRTGPPTQVVERLRAEARAEERLVAALGLDFLAGRLAGAPPATVQLAARRNGQAEAAIRADLREARLALPEAAYEKPQGQPGTAEATLRLAGERLVAVDAIRIEAPGLSARGRATFAAGAVLERITIASLVLGRTRVTSGEVTFGRDGALSITARGSALDASPLFAPATQPAPAPSPPGPAAPLRLDLGFERVHLANQRTAEAVSLRLDRRGGPAGGSIEALAASARIGDGAVDATVARRADGRTLSLRAADAGAFLAAMDIIDSMAGGRMVVDGRFDGPRDALSGTAELADFRVRDAPAIGRLLQGMTLYGLLDLARGPGLNFSQATLPFTWADGVLSLADARAFSPSLGVTVKGRIDTRARALDLEGTLVPAYFFNTLLGNIPLIGRLFSPERGGGVFAATFAARGPMADPAVSVNPLAALTPGFLRGLFGIFDGGGGAAPGAPAAPAPAAGTGATPPG